MSKWMDNAISEEKAHILVDLGYVNSAITRNNADKLKAQGIGKRNFELAGFGRLLVSIPPSKLEKIMGLFPIVPKAVRAGYAWCTHTWIEGDAADLKYTFRS